MKEKTDKELLEAYSAERSEEAFRELVGRHADVIYSAAMRQLGDAHFAQEATQAAFIALASNAGKLKRQSVVVGCITPCISPLKTYREVKRGAGIGRRKRQP